MSCSELYKSFNAAFPRHRLSEMTLEEYTNLEKKDSFCYWLEAKTSGLGSIWGGSAYKFGIYKYNVIPRRSDKNYRYDNEYAWLAKYGDDRKGAFEKIRAIICRIAEAAFRGNYQEIDSLDLGDAVKWKIAFLYSHEHLVSIFNPNVLRVAAKTKGLENAKSNKVSEIQQFLIERKGNEDIYSYSGGLWESAQRIIRSHRNTWVYAPGDNACFWEDFYEEGIMAIGWDGLGDLFQYKNQSNINASLREIYDIYTNKSNDAKACFDFCRTLKKGDTIIVKKGLNEIVGSGVVESDYYYDKKAETFKHRRKVSWEHMGAWTSPVSLPRKTLTLKDEKFRSMVMKIIETKVAVRPYKDGPIKQLLLSKKQIILQGAPGTGKTYKTAELAVAVCNPEFEAFDDRRAIMDEYNRLRAAGQIVFTTFHQSMDYEEFIEGLRPVVNGSCVLFEPRAGLFKEVCDRALLNTISISGNISAELEYDDMYDSLLENISSGKVKELPTRTGQKLVGLMITPQKNIRFRPHEGGRYTVSKERLRNLYREFGTPAEVDGIKNIYDEVRRVIGGCNTSGYWAVLKYLVDHRNTSEEELADIENLSDAEKESVIQAYLNTPSDARANNENPKNYILIIDEINRGNISKILGELISLLEADKRIGCENELTVKLPYSQKEFGVPNNLYIIGTMNTADRSVGCLDYAIRRRFAFVPVAFDLTAMTAYYEKNEGLGKVAAKLFEDVRAVIDHIRSEFNIEDLMLGHSYFMADSFEELEMKLQYEIKPLLREYVCDGIINLSKNEDGKYECIENLSINLAEPAHEQ